MVQGVPIISCETTFETSVKSYLFLHYSIKSLRQYKCTSLLPKFVINVIKVCNKFITLFLACEETPSIKLKIIKVMFTYHL